MIKVTQAARPYAKAAFGFAMTHNNVLEWQSGLQLLAQLMMMPVVQKLIGTPQSSPTQIADIIVPIVADKIPADLVSFVRLLAAKRRLLLLPAIDELYQEYVRQLNQVLPVTITTAAPWTAGDQAQLTQALTVKLGRQVLVEWTIDPALLGGAVIHAGDQVIDGSYRHQILRLKEQLRK